MGAPDCKVPGSGQVNIKNDVTMRDPNIKNCPPYFVPFQEKMWILDRGNLCR